ncbi:MAG TPA: single-stranded-DNA-specific exonuclease RecJ [Dongiaceae bacterium]|nr:single-stranded-DNA-specific exonuclease RecJ [Dongiaceae bacterium]
MLAEPLVASGKFSPLLAHCLLNRGLSDPAQVETFLAPRLKHLADPFRLPNLAAAVDRLWQARERAEPLVIFGDYDVDGVTSTTILVEVLRTLGWSVHYYLPHRMDEGYGLSQEGVENCLKKYPVKLLLAVDCGSTAVRSIAWLREQGVDVIVLDHHQVSRPAPAAVALVNPQLLREEKDSGPGGGTARAEFTELCSAGLAFKLAHAIVKRGRETGLPGAAEFDLRPLLDLVALGTVADIVPLTGENRILVAAGLERLNTTRRPGLVALKAIAESPEKLGVTDVGYQLAPRLNAAGRLENAAEALHLLLAGDEAEATPLAQNLDAQNRERQKIERGISTEVIGAVRARFRPETDLVIVEGQLLWHIGVVGIVASRVLQQFYRPTFIIGGDGGAWRGSGRSIAGFDLAAALRECDDLLIRHGGHAMAAGVTIAPEKVDAFRNRLNDIARRQLRPEDLQPPLHLDAEVTLAQLNLRTLAELNRLQPFGPANPPVQFCVRRLTHARPLQRMGKEKQHVKLWVTDGRATHECVWWNGGGESLPVGEFDLAFVPQVNDFNGRTTVQLRVLDWRPAEK